jgi:hypothetical protein
MSENLTVYTLTGELESRPSGSLTINPESVGGEMLPQYSSSNHEVTRLNAIVSGVIEYRPDTVKTWRSTSGRSAQTTSSQYAGERMMQPTAVSTLYYTKNTLSGSVDPKFKRLMYVLNSSDTGTIPGGSGSSYWNTADRGDVEGGIGQYGRIVDANSQDTFQAWIPVNEKGKIRDIRVWVELVHKSRTPGDYATGLKGLQIAMLSPNVRGKGAYPIWNMNGAEEFLYDANPNVTGTDGLLGRSISNVQPEIFASGAYILWDGHVNTVTPYAVSNMGLQGNWSEFDNDLDMRTVFSDNSPNYNPRSRIKVFPSATDGNPGAATDLQSSLISSTAGFQPLNYYYSPSNYAMRNFSSTLNWNGPSVTVTGAWTPWYVDPRMPNAALKENIIGTPPPGWVTGEPNGLFYPWSGAETSTSGTIWGYTSGALAGANHIYANTYAISGVLQTGETIRIIDSLTGSNYADVQVTSFTWPNKVSFSPNLSIPFNNGSAIYLRSQVSMTINTSPVNASTFYVGYNMSYNFSQNELDYFQDESFIYDPTNVTIPVISSGSIIYWGGRFLRVLTSSNNLYVYDSQDEVAPEGPYGVIRFDQYRVISSSNVLTQHPPDYLAINSPSTVKTTTSTLPAVGPESLFSSTFDLNNRWGFSYAFLPGGQTQQMILVGGYTGSVAGNLSGNFVDLITFSGSEVISAFRTGAISNHVDDDGYKRVRTHGGLFIANLKPANSATFYILVGGGQTGTLAITSSGQVTYSTASVVSTTWSSPYQYKYWVQSTYYDDGDGGGGGGGCVTPDTSVVIDSYGHTMPAGDLRPGHQVWTYPEGGGSAGLFTIESMKKLSNLCMRITLKDGRSMKCSINHKMNIRGIWRRADSIQVGEELQGYPGGIVKSTEYLSEMPVILLSIPGAKTYLGGDGAWHHNTTQKN